MRTAAKTSLQCVEGRSDRIYGLSPEKFASLVALGRDPEVRYRAMLRRVYDETGRYLDSLTRDAREGKAVDEAANFARWLQFSGVLDLWGEFAPSDMTFPSMAQKLNDLIQTCGEHFRGGRVSPKYGESDIAEINRKLDVLLASSARSASDGVVSLPAPFVGYSSV